jgi:hypothetical protein
VSGRGGQQISGNSKHFSFFLKKPKKSTPCKIKKPYDNPFWEKSNIGGEKKKK